MRTNDWRYESDNRVVNVYRDAMGFPRLPQAHEVDDGRPTRGQSAAIAVACLGLVLLVAMVCL